MFRKLQLQLTSLCLVITGLVLFVLSGICLYVTESGIRRQENDVFLTNADSFYQSLAQQVTLSHSWLRQMEENYDISLRLLDGTEPLLFQSLNPSDVPDALWETIRETAQTEYGLNLQSPPAAIALTQHEEFIVRSTEGRAYCASAALLPRPGGSVAVCMAHALDEMNHRIRLQRLIFLLADLTALVLLGTFYWFFTARMLRPIQENRKKQMQFVASASHELRSPLTVILSSIAAVKNGIMPNNMQFLDTLHAEGSRMSRLIADMLQLAGADNRTWSICPSETEPDTLLLQTWETYEPLAAARRLKWDISLPDEAVPHSMLDEERIRQLLSILIDNALCYTPAGGRVCLSLAVPPKEHCLHLCVSDNGPGIPDDQKEAVFERFCRLDASRKDKTHFGLGLCIAQEIVSLHQGKLLLTDTPGGGATFTAVLPLRP